MKNRPIFLDLMSSIKLVDKSFPGCRWFLFGSATKLARGYKDLDILIAYESVEAAKAIRLEMIDLCLQWPIHLLFFSSTELKESNFIASQDCVEIFPNFPKNQKTARKLTSIRL